MKIFKRNLKVMSNGRQGFTLIELLVVIAIIGMLSSVVLVSLNSARGKGADAAIKANMSSARTQAEIVYDSQGAYGAANVTTVATCPTTGASLFLDPIIAQQIFQIKAVSVIVACASYFNANGGSWAMASSLKSSPTLGWCVDSMGIVKGTTLSGPATQPLINGLITVNTTPGSEKVNCT